MDGIGKSWELELNQAVLDDLYFFCFYQVQVKTEKLYHHVIIKANSENDLIKNLITKDYQYFLRAVSPLQLSKEARENAVIKHLIWDGESLVAKIKNSKPHQKPSKTNESN